MTKPWSIPPDFFAGETVAILATGPDMTQELADSVQHYRRIAVRRAALLAPDADMLVALDGPSGSKDDGFWADVADFEGLKVCGTECEVDALFPGIAYETVEMGPAHTIEIRNNGLAAIRLAAQGGAGKILLVGFDGAHYEKVHAPWTGLVKGLEQMTNELRARGVHVEHFDASR